MSNPTHRTLGVLVVAAAFAAPATAHAASIETALKSVKTHTDRADAALDRAVALFERQVDRRATAQLALSRKELGLATAGAAKLRRTADSGSERAAAARAQALVAGQRDADVEQLVEVLDEAQGRAERRVAAAALADTRGREKAIAVISSLLADGVPAKAAGGLARALGALATDRGGEIVAEAEVLAGDDVAARAKGTVAKTVEVSVDGQASAADRIAGLLADEQLPQVAKTGLQSAYDAVTAEHGTVADVLSRFSDRMPARIRAFVEAVVTQARTDAQSMRDKRPAAPGGPPESTPAGPPESTPGGQPESTPGGQPESTPAGPPESTPGGQPESTPAGPPESTPGAPSA